MGKKTKIEYCDSTINPVVGCTGCELFDKDPTKSHCYAHALCQRMAGNKGWPDDFQEPQFYSHRLPMAIKWPDLTGTDRPDKPWLNGKPRIIFVNDLGDGFCPDVNPDKWLTPVLDGLAQSPHIWLFLTKWPLHMIDYFWGKYHNGIPSSFWLGTTVTSPDTTYRAAVLSDIKVMSNAGDTNLWLSMEPLLQQTMLKDRLFQYFSWVAAGGESGPNARPSQPDWFRSLRDQCQEYNIPFFFKQWGEWSSFDNAWPHVDCSDLQDVDNERMLRVGKKAAGRILDGKEWNQVPW